MEDISQSTAYPMERSNTTASRMLAKQWSITVDPGYMTSTKYQWKSSDLSMMEVSDSIYILNFSGTALLGNMKWGTNLCDISSLSVW